MFNTFEQLVAISPIVIQERLEKLKTNPERLDYHPEGNTYDHIKIVTERLMQTGDMDLIMAGLFHDLFKLETTKPHPKKGHPCAFGHEIGSARLVLDNENKEFIKRCGGNVGTVHGIVLNHMKMKQYDKMKPNKQKILDELPYIKKLRVFTLADSMLTEWDINNVKKMLE